MGYLRPRSQLRASRLCDGSSSSPITASCQTGYVKGDLYPWSRLRAKHAMRWEILIPGNGFEPPGYVAGNHHLQSRLYAHRFTYDHWRHTRLHAVQVMWQVTIPLVTALCHTGLHVALIAHKALCHTGNVSGVHRPRSWLVPTGFMCRPWWHTRLYAMQEIWRVFIVSAHGFMPTCFTCRPWWHMRRCTIRDVWRIHTHRLGSRWYACRFWASLWSRYVWLTEKANVLDCLHEKDKRNIVMATWAW
jgi:hypothetical protein